MAQGWAGFITGLISRVPVEKVLVPRRDPAAELQKFLTGLQSSETQKEASRKALPDVDPLAARPGRNITSTVAEKGPPSEQKPMIILPTTEQTVQELKRRLAKELYRMEMDLQAGARIAGRPCDCLSYAKHLSGVEATAEELMSYERNPIYGEIVLWLRAHEVEFEPQEIAKHPPDYYQTLAPEVRNFRKEVMGTEKLTPFLSAEDKEKIKKRAAEIIDASV